MGNDNRGYTLIELMIVVAIVALLVSIALPMYTGYTVRAKWGSNIADLEGVKRAISICMQDVLNDGSQCDTVSELQKYGYVGADFVQPRYSSGNISLSGGGASSDGVGYIDISFGGSEDVGSYIYAARCQRNESGNFGCTAIIGSDTIPDVVVRGSGR